MTSIRLTKLHATGNDFLVLDALADVGAASRLTPSGVRGLCDRHRGVGADGLVVLLPGPDGADCSMLLVNADGQPAETSGNGMRCLSWVAHRGGLGSGDRLVVTTAHEVGSGREWSDLDLGARRHEVEVVVGAGGQVTGATVDMGPVTFDPAAIPLSAPSALDLEVSYHGVDYRGDAVGVGNPHLVLFVDDVATTRVTQHGLHLERDPRFPHRTNVEFVQPGPRSDSITMRVWERGVGETLSCGTGACAGAAAAHRRGLVGAAVTVHVPGGRLAVELGKTARLGGSVCHVFDVDVDPARLVGTEAP